LSIGPSDLGEAHRLFAEVAKAPRLFFYCLCLRELGALAQRPANLDIKRCETVLEFEWGLALK
jgi:hypothetical protein